MGINVLIIISVVMLFIIFLIVLFNSRGKLLILDIKITEAEKELDSLYEIKKELLFSICKKIDELAQKELFSNIEELNNENLDSFELSNLLNSIENKLINEMSMRKAFVPDDEDSILFSSLESASIDCKSVEKYYNDTADKFNKLLRRFPSNIIGKMKDYKNADKYTYEEEEMFEILKD